MRSFLYIGLVSGALLGPLRAEPVREWVFSGIPISLRGVNPGMDAAVRLVLEKQIGLSGDRAVSAPLADDLAFFVRQRYLQLGYSRVRVDWQVEGRAARLEVVEGPRLTVGRVAFSGIEPAQEEVLRPYLTRQTREREGRLAKALPFVEDDLQAGLGLVLRKIQAEGYLQARVAPLVFQENPAAGATDLRVEVALGSISLFGPIAVEGDAGPLSAAARKQIAALAGQPFSEVRLEGLRQAVKGDLQSRGRFAAEVTSSFQLGEAGAVPAVLLVRPGQLFKVAEVRTDQALGRGAGRVADAVFHAATGQGYDPEALDLLYRRSLDTGIFSQLEVEPIKVGPDRLALSIRGELAKPKTLGFFGGYETFYGPIAGIEARHVNFLDSGNALGLRAELRGTGANGSLQWADPAFLGSRNALGLGLAAESFTFKDYGRHTVSLRGSLTRRLDRHLTAEAFAGATLNAVESDVLTAAELGPTDYGTLSAGGRFTGDFRDNPLNPRSGWLAAASLEGGFDQGSDADISFARSEFSASWYHPLGGAWRMALGARAAALASSGDLAELPIDLRLFNGGGTSVRSFAEREMGPSSASGSTPLGGTATAVLNGELSYLIINSLEAAAFADAGSLGAADNSLWGNGDLRYALGMGLRYQLPIGPLRLDYGWNPDRHPGEAAGAFHVTFGFAF